MSISNGMKFRWSRYIPRVGKDGKPFRPHPKQLALLMMPYREVLMTGTAGSGKVLFDGSEILTPYGFKKGKDLKLGDMVNNPDGSYSRVIQLHPRKSYKVWRVFFNDNTFTDVAEGHLWLAWKAGQGRKIEGQRGFGENYAEVVETKTLKEWSDKANEQNKKGVRANYPLIPICQEQRFNLFRRNVCSLDPYILGYWLGDGCTKGNSKSVVLTTGDNQHLEKYLNDLGYHYVKHSEKDYALVKNSGTEFRKYLKELGLINAKSSSKFIPKEYLYGSIERRWGVIQGLMDTDGTVDKTGNLSFTSTSQQLAEDVKTLVQSLGGTATITEKIPYYKDSQGKRVYCSTAYTLYMKHREPWKFFKLNRKVERCTKEPQTMYRRVTEVRVLESEKKGRCITVSHPNGLYLTNDFIVTHNSDAILMAACQYLDCPNYNALIIRPTISDSKLAQSIYDRARKWFNPFVETGEVKHDGSTSTFTFPSGATIAFSYLKTELSHFRYQGTEFDFIAFEELTLYQRDQYTFLFRSLRSMEGSIIPPRMWSSTNPTGVGMDWVKQRFRITWDEDLEEWVGKHPLRKIIQCYTSDNPSLGKNYIYSLNELDPVTRAQLRDGDWSTGAMSRFKPWYFKDRWITRGKYFSALSSRKSWHRDTCEIFFSVDPAGTQRSMPGGLVFQQNRQPCWSVIGVWARTPDNYLLLLDIVRKQCEIPEMIHWLTKAARVYKPSRIICERNGMGIGVTQIAAMLGLPINPVWTSVDKINNASDAMIRAERQTIILPEDAPWLDDFESEVLNWMGAPNEVDDQVDVLANAAKYVQQQVGGSEIEYINEVDEIPEMMGGWSNGATPGML